MSAEAMRAVVRGMRREWRTAGRCTRCGLKGCAGTRGPWCPYARKYTAVGPVPPQYAHQVAPWPESAAIAKQYGCRRPTPQKEDNQ